MSHQYTKQDQEVMPEIFFNILFFHPAVLVASYFYLPVLQPRCSLAIIVSCSNIIDS